MGDSERNSGRADHEAGERSTAEGETQPPNAAKIDENARFGEPSEHQRPPRDDVAARRHEANADMGQEGSADTSPEGGTPERKPRA